MIIKGQSRAGPEQLAIHLQRTDTNERVEVLEVQSLPQDLAEVFRDWQCFSGAFGDEQCAQMAPRQRMTPAIAP